MVVPDQIPYEDFGGLGALMHFSHANGYPPGAYRPLFERLTISCRVLAMHMRPLWPESDPMQISSWVPLADDLGKFLETFGEKFQVGAGHSMGATTTLRLALRRPDQFDALILIDPVIMPPAMSRIWNLVCRLRLEYRVHPLAKGALRRRSTFESRQRMYVSYRLKQVFARMDDRSLSAFVEASSCPNQDGTFHLCYPPDWEARIYVTGLRADLDLWRDLPRLKTPLLILRGALSGTFRENTARMIHRCLPSAEIQVIPDATHLVPLECPEQIAAAITDFLSRMNLLTSPPQSPSPERTDRSVNYLSTKDS